MRDDMSELKKRAMAIVDIYSDIHRITEREANILYQAITEDRPKGKWIKSKDGYTRCDQCGSRGSAIKARFCHHCGAEMRGEKDDK